MALKRNKIKYCTISGCSKKARSNSIGVCEMHYYRFRRNGRYDLIARKKKEFIVHSEGYILHLNPDHILSEKRGYIYQHREVAYSKYGDGPHNCELCNKNITWSTLHVDHIDNARTNNAPENLRLLCQRCNTHRKKRTIYQRNGRTIPIKIGGIIKSSVEWAENDGCQVSRGTIIRRLKSGMSPKEAVFKETRNHISWTKKHKDINRER